MPRRQLCGIPLCGPGGVIEVAQYFTEARCHLLDLTQGVRQQFGVVPPAFDIECPKGSKARHLFKLFTQLRYHPVPPDMGGKKIGSLGG